MRAAAEGRVPPASGVMVSALLLPAGFLTVRSELMTVVVMSEELGEVGGTGRAGRTSRAGGAGQQGP